MIRARAGRVGDCRRGHFRRPMAQAVHQRLYAVRASGWRFGGPVAPKETLEFPERAPDFEELQCPSPDQAAIYRLSGETFALHIDPDLPTQRVRKADRARLVHLWLCLPGRYPTSLSGEPERLSRFRVRFSKAL